MKKYLITAALAISIGGVFVSCKDDDFSDSLIEQKAKAFEEAFIESFGTPVPNHTWGFRKDVTTRTSHPNKNQWDDPNYYGYVVPSTPSAIEREYVMNWFSEVKSGNGETLDVNNYFVQQIGYGEDYAGDWGNCKYSPNAQFLEKYENGEPYYRTEHPEVKSKYQMDWIAANLTLQTANRSDIGLNLYAGPDDSNGEGFSDFDHIYNFNAGSGDIMLMKDSETKYGFSFHDSYGTDDKLVTQNYYMVHLVADYKGEHIDGWYVGFDYQTLKKQVYNDGTHYVEYNYVDLQPDGRYNDRVVKIVPAGEQPDDEEWEQIVTREEIMDAGRVFCEDLGASNRSDIDYNDIVFDAVIVHETKTLVTEYNETPLSDKYYAKVCLLAAGGTIPATVGGHEIHNLFECSTNVMINTTKDRAKVNGAVVGEHAPVIIDRIDDVKTIDGIKIFALYNDKLIEVTNNGKNLAAYKICVPIGTRWAKERVNIGIAYKSFAEYCNKDPNIEFWNKETNKVTNDSLWDDSATPSPFEGESYKVGKVTYNYETRKIIWRNGVNNAISWTSSKNFYRFALKGKDSNNECLAEFPKKAWDIIKGGTFYLTFQPTEEWYQIRITNGWWDTQWMGAENDFSPSNMADRIIDNGDDTYTIEINFGNDPIVSTLDQKHLLLTGTGYRPLKLYYIE